MGAAQLVSEAIGVASLVANILLYRHIVNTRTACRFCKATIIHVHKEGCGHPDNPSNNGQ